jgi:hypothetical protein
MHINNLGGARMPVTTTAGTSQTARTSFSTLVQGGAAAPTAGRGGLSGSSVIASAISGNSGGAQGFGGPYMQAANGAQTQTPGAAAGTEPRSELDAKIEQQKALKELMQLSLTSFVNTTFSMGQNRPKADDW